MSAHHSPPVSRPPPWPSPRVFAFARRAVPPSQFHVRAPSRSPGRVHRSFPYATYIRPHGPLPAPRRHPLPSTPPWHTRVSRALLPLSPALAWPHGTVCPTSCRSPIDASTCFQPAAPDVTRTRVAYGGVFLCLSQISHVLLHLIRHNRLTRCVCDRISNESGKSQERTYGLHAYRQEENDPADVSLLRIFARHRACWYTSQRPRTFLGVLNALLARPWMDTMWRPHTTA